jgi:predicted amidohydrolase YtcJ
MVADRYFDDHSAELANVIADTLEHQVAGGFTTYSSHIVGLSKMPAFRKLDKEGRMPMRLAFSDRYCNQVEPNVVGCFLRKGEYAGMGSKYFWNIGMTLGGIDAGPPTICSTMEAAPEYKAQEYCIIQPDNHYGRAVYTALRSRYRYVVNHDYGDKGVDIVMDIMEKVMKESRHHAGFHALPAHQHRSLRFLSPSEPGAADEKPGHDYQLQPELHQPQHPLAASLRRRQGQLHLAGRQSAERRSDHHHGV